MPPDRLPSLICSGRFLGSMDAGTGFLDGQICAQRVSRDRNDSEVRHGAGDDTVAADEPWPQANDDRTQTMTANKR